MNVACQSPRRQRVLKSAVAAAVLVAVALLYGLTLTTVPGVHCDEPWLAERSLSLLETGQFSYSSFPLSYAQVGSISPAADVLQVNIFRLLGYNLTSVRLLSLAAFLGSLFFWYRVILALSDEWAAVAFLYLYPAQVLVFYAAHIGRFEMPIIFVFSVAVYLAVAWRPGISAQVRFFLVAATGSLAVFFHVAGALVPVVAVLVGAWAQRLPRAQLLRAALSATAGALAMAILYLSLIDLDALRWALTGDYRNAVGPQAASTGGFSAYLSNWLQLTLRGSWVAGPIYEGTLLTAICLPWFIVGLSMRRTRFGVATLLIGAALTLLLLAVIGHPNEHYLVYISPWAAGALAIGLTAVGTGRPNQRTLSTKLWWGAALATLVLFGLRLLVFITVAYRGNFQDYRASLQAGIPAGTVVFATIENQILVVGANRLVALDDLRMLHRMGRSPAVGDYFAGTGVGYVILDAEAYRTLRRPASQPWGEEVITYIHQHGRLVARVPNDYLRLTPGIAPLAPVGGVLAGLHPAYWRQSEAPTEIWQLPQRP